jgi:excisionase family DNA binding protein
MIVWISVEEAANLSGYKAAYLRRLIRQGDIGAVKKGHDWWVNKDSVLDYCKSVQQSTDQRRGPKSHKTQ